MRPVWLCPLRLRERSRQADLAVVPAARRARPTSTSASGAPSTIGPDAADGDDNRAVEAEVPELGGHKSLYSDAYYDRETFDRLYGVDQPGAGSSSRHDPDHRLTGLYEKAVNRR